MKLREWLFGCDHDWECYAQAEYIPRNERAASGIILLRIVRCKKCGRLETELFTFGTELVVVQAKETTNDH